MPPYPIHIDEVIAPLISWITWIIDQAGRTFAVIWAGTLFVIRLKYFPHTIAVIIVAGAIFRICQAYRKWNEGWLSELIEKNLQEIRRRPAPQPSHATRYSFRTIRSVFFRSIRSFGQYVAHTAPTDIKTLYLPSLTSFFVVAVIVALFFVIPHLAIFSFDFSTPMELARKVSSEIKKERLEEAAKVFDGLGLIVVALIIFVAESIRDDKNLDQRRVLLKISYLWPLALVIILSPLGFLWSAPTEFFTVLEVLIALFSIYALARMISHLINIDTREEDRRKFLQDRIRRILQRSAWERIGNNVLINKLGSEKEIKIEYSLSRGWLAGDQKDYVFIDAAQKGWLSDINLLELDSMVKLLQDRAQRLGFSLSATPDPELETVTRNDTVRNTLRSLGHPKKAYLLKRFGELLPPDSIFNKDAKALLAIPKELSNDKGLLEEVRARLPQIFRFSDAAPPSVAFRQELQGTKDELISAIRAESLGSIKELRQTYLQIAEEFLTLLHELGGGYSPEQADKERNSLFDGWDEIDWLREDLREIMVAASKTDNRDIIADTAFLPVAIATRALKVKDHFLFREFLNFTNFLYYLAKEKPVGSKIREFMIDRAWRYPKEVAEYHLRASLEDGDGDESSITFSDLRDFGLYIFKIFLQLLKGAVDDNDAETFQKFLKEFSGLASHLFPEDNAADSEILKLMLEGITDEAKRSEMQAQIDQRLKKEEATKALSFGYDQVLFGLGSWVLDRFLQSNNNDVQRAILMAIVEKMSSDLNRLTTVFDSIEGRNAADQWGWSWWDVIPDGEARFVDTYTRPNQLYCFKALLLIGGLSTEQTAIINLPPSQNLARVMRQDSQRSLLTTLDNIRTNRDRWINILSPAQLDKIDALTEMLLRAKKTEEDAEEARLKSSGIDPDLLLKFKNAVVGEFTKQGHIRKLMKRLEAFKDLPGKAPGSAVPSWGFNQLDDKAAFIKDWPVGYAGWGAAYGRNLAQSEDHVSFEQLVAGIDQKKGVSQENLITEIELAVREGRFKDPIIIQSLIHNIEYEEIRRNDLFIPKYRDDCPKTPISDLDGFLGALKCGTEKIPVFDVFVRGGDFKNHVLVTDLAKLAHWEQYSPVDEQEDDVHVTSSLFIRVIDLNRDDGVRNRILSENPAWLAEKPDKEGYLRGRVVIKIFEKFKVTIDDRTAGICLTVAEEKGDSDNQTV
jgi:hypothetical protein